MITAKNNVSGASEVHAQRFFGLRSRENFRCRSFFTRM